MSNRFKLNFNDRDFWEIEDLSSGKFYDISETSISDAEELVDLLNSLQNKCNDCLNEISRIEEGLESLDILIGDLSWVTDENEAPNDIDRIRSVSFKLSKCITDVMYPKVESMRVSGFHD